jgi:hypothetical protein
MAINFSLAVSLFKVFTLVVKVFSFGKGNFQFGQPTLVKEEEGRDNG